MMKSEATERIVLRSGEKDYVLEVPRKNLVIFHEPSATALTADEAERRINECLASPRGTLPLVELARDAGTAVVIVDDWGRSVPTRHMVAPIVLDHLNEAGIPDEQITVVIGRGLGLCPPEEVIEEAFGPALTNRSIKRCVSSYHHSHCIFLGFTSYGTPVWINRVVTEADLTIGIGTAFPSPWGGWSGGAKIIVPGVAAAETIRQNHTLMVRGKPGSVDHPGLADREEIASMVGLDFLVNLVLTPGGEIATVEAGELLETHQAIREAYLELYEVSLPAKPDIVITTIDWFGNAVVPMRSLYGFLDASLANLACFADPGATVIVAGPCPEGIWAGMREYMRTAYSIEDLALLLPQAGSLAFVSVLLGIQFKMHQDKFEILAVIDGISEATFNDIGVKKMDSLEGAVDVALAKHGPDAKIAVLPALGCPTYATVNEQAASTG